MWQDVVAVIPTPSGTGEWLRVQFRYNLRRGFDEVFGFVPARLDGRETLKPFTYGPCAPTPDRTYLGGMRGPDRLQCYGDRELTVDGFLEPQPSSFTDLYRVSPRWLDPQQGWNLVYDGGPAITTGEITTYIDPADGLSRYEGHRVIVTGHFDDERAARCRRRPASAIAPPESAEESSYICRQQFVVTSITPRPD